MTVAVFLDANVLFSAAYQDGLARSLWGHVQRRGFTLKTSAQAVAEARFNLGRKGTEGSVERLEALLDSVLVVQRSVRRHPDDLGLPEPDHLILSAAIAEGVDCFLTGDRRHFGPLFGRSVGGVQVLTVRDFVDRMAQP